MRCLPVILCALLGVNLVLAGEAFDWWSNAYFYQIYPRSFMDSDNDGVGDLQGIISRLDHLVTLGVTAVWLSPIYKSPMKDFGYDISDFRDIDPTFGTMEDFDRFVAKAKELGLKVIMDFVPNHTSDEHEWFQRALRGEEKYRDYYVWADGKGVNGDEPPTNWISYFHGSTWTKPENQSQYYLHQFHEGQPDLDFRNPEVVEEMIDVLRFWLDKGVDGFRVDTVPSLVEAINPDGTFSDEELTNDPNCTPNDRCHVRGDLQSDQDGTFEVVYILREFLDDYKREHGGDTRVMMTEAYSSIENLQRYCRDVNDRDRRGAHFTFNFRFITHVNKESNAADVVNVAREWLIEMDGLGFNWVLGNHDQHRLASRYGPHRADGMIMLQTMLVGAVVTYMGEEIGMENGEVTFEQGADPQGCDAGSEEQFQRQSRDFQRTPFQWDNSTNAGFNRGAQPWLPVGSKYAEINVANQENAENSPMKMYQELIRLRAEENFNNVMALVVKPLNNDNVVLVIRHSTDDTNWTLLMNTSDQDQILDLSDLQEQHIKLVACAVSVVSRDSGWSRGEEVEDVSSVRLNSQGAVIFRCLNERVE